MCVNSICVRLPSTTPMVTPYVTDLNQKKKFKMGFEGITKSKFAEALLYREQVGSGYMLSKERRIGFWEG